MNKNANVNKYILGLLSLIVIFGFIIKNNKKDMYTLSKDNKKDMYALSNEQISNLNLEDTNIKSLLDLYYKEDDTSEKENIACILNNINKIPLELLELAIRNNEAIDFVSNYPFRKKYKKISIKDDYTPGEIPLFLQWDERWGYNKYSDEFLAINGCAPTSLAMVIVGLTGDTSINPKVIADYSYNNGFYVEGVGTSWSLMTDGASYFGLNSEYLNLNKSSILTSLKKGNPVIASVKPGIFTTVGHFLVVTGLDEDGKLIINDPNSIKNSSKTWDVDVFLNEVKALWKMRI